MLPPITVHNLAQMMKSSSSYRTITFPIDFQALNAQGYPETQTPSSSSSSDHFPSSIPRKNRSPFPPPLPRGLALPLLLSPKRAALGQARLAASGLAQHGGAAAADDDGLRVREDGRDGEAAGAFDVHEEGAGGGDEHLGGNDVSLGLTGEGVGSGCMRNGILGRGRERRGRALSLCLRSSACGVGLRRSTARTCHAEVSVSH